MIKVYIGESLYTLEESKKYKNCLKVHNTMIYIHKDCIRAETKVEGGRSSIRNIITRGKEFEQFIFRWQEGRALWYRGISGSHWQWEQAANFNKIASESSINSRNVVDRPVYTMSEDIKTVWLPGDICYDTALCVSIQNLENFELYKTECVPVSGIIRVILGPQVSIPICLMPGSEIQIRGPILYPMYTMHHLVWMYGDIGTISSRVTGLPIKNLIPPARPYVDKSSNLSNQEISDIYRPWIRSFREWKREVWDKYATEKDKNQVNKKKDVPGDNPIEMIYTDQMYKHINSIEPPGHVDSPLRVKDLSSCARCRKEFGYFKTKYHCLHCGSIFDSGCFNKEKKLCLNCVRAS